MTIVSKPYGLSLADQHGSAKGQTSAKVAYRRLAEAASRKKSPFGPEHEKMSRARAVRVGIDRLRRLGERYRENFRVAPRDHVLMKKEFSILKKKIAEVMQRSADSIMLQDEANQFSIAENATALNRLLTRVFQGKVRPSDELASTGDLKDQEADQLAINFSGNVDLQPLKINRQRSAEEVLTSRTSTNMRVPVEFQGVETNEQWVDKAIDRVGDAINQDSLKAVDTQVNGQKFESAALLYK